MNDPSPRPRYVPALDGLRGIGLIGMLLYHAGAPFARGAIFTISMFFTLSGFLITSLMLHERHRTGTVNLKSFWVRRFRRLLPGALLGLTLVLIFGMFVADQTQRANLRGDIISALVYVANWRFLFNGTDYLNAVSSPSPALHFWSLAIEEQFYLLLPLLVVVLVGRRLGHHSPTDAHRSRVRLGVGAGVLIAVSALLPIVFAMSQNRVYLGTDTRASEILMGVVLAVLMARVPLGHSPGRTWWARALTVIGPVALVVMVASWAVVDEHSEWIYRGGFALYAVLSATVIAAGSIPGNPVARILSPKPLAKWGRLSYGIYLYHWPIFLWLTPELLGWVVDPMHPGKRFWALFAIRVGLTFAIAYLSWRFIEEPLRVGKPMFGQPLRRLAPIAAALLVVTLLAVTSGVKTGTVSEAAAAETALRTDNREADQSSPIPDELLQTAGTATTSTAPPFTPSTTWSVVPGGLPPKPVIAPKRPLRLLIVGDSSAVFLAFALNTWNDKTKVFDINSYALMGCPVGRGGTEFSPSVGEDKFDPKCFEWEATWTDAVATVKPDVIMVASGYHDATDRRLTPDGPWQHLGEPAYDAWLSSEYDVLIRVLSKANAPILWLDNPPLRRARNLANGQFRDDPANDPARMDYLNGLVHQMADRHPNVRVIDYAKFFWTWPGGPMDPVLREDGLHVDYAGREIVGDWLGPELLDAYWQAVLPGH